MNRLDDGLGDSALAKAARRVVQMVKNNSLEHVSDSDLCNVLLVAAGLCRGNVAFPNVTDAQALASNDGKIFTLGVRIGFQDRLNEEKASCQGAA